MSWVWKGFLATELPLLFLKRPILIAGERMDENSPIADWKFESAVVFDIIDATEKFFYMFGPPRLTIDFDAETFSNFGSLTATLEDGSGALPASC